MEIKVVTSQLVNGHPVTQRQIEVLRAIRDEGSKNAAAKKLGISAPVVHNYIASVEKGTGVKLLDSTPGGTELTEDALHILETAELSERRVDFRKKFTVACTPVTSDLVMSALNVSKVKAELIISDDITNMKMLKDGTADMIFLDDPVYLFDLEGYLWNEIGHMDMIHVDNGPSYIRYKYGAQRIAYEYLDSIDADYSIDAETYLVTNLLNSGKSFFVDEFLLLRNGVKLKSSTDKHLLTHTINAVYRKETKCGEKIFRAIRSKHMI